MKNKLGVLVVVLLITACSNNSFLTKKEANDSITHQIELKNGIAYLPDDDKPFTGIFEENYYGTHKERETNFINGKKNGPSTWWYQNGRKWIQVTYVNEKRQGLFTTWYENGNKWIEENYLDGKKDGLAVMWYQNGQKRYEIIYKQGKKNGAALWWDKNGQVERKENFQDDLKIN
ncbi:MAG: toxin-antitoxin system YwqK family antitoxin [Methylococcaceae bacterium]